LKIAYFLTHPIQYQSPLIRALEAAGVDVHVVYGPMAADWAAHDAELGRQVPWDVPLLEGYSHEFVQSPFMFGPVGLLCLRSRIKRLLQRLQPGAVWIHGWGDVYSVAAWNVAWVLGIPVLLRGESHLKCLRGGPLRRWLHRQILTRCFGTVSHFLAIGSANREFYLSYQVSPWKIVDVPYAVDNAWFARKDEAIHQEMLNCRERLGIAKHETVIGFFGKLKKAKRPDLALRGVALAAAGLPPEQRPWLLFVGDGPLRDRMEKLAASLYPERTLFVGFQNQTRLPALYHLVDLLLLPSDYEPWGLVVNEAMNAARPVIVSDRVGCAQDLVKSQVNGGIFRAGDAEDLAAVLRPFLVDAARREQAGRESLAIINTWSYEEDLNGLQQAVQLLEAKQARK
jgi:glycosyltransferase involved in cell wall biosynthesis